MTTRKHLLVQQTTEMIRGARPDLADEAQRLIELRLTDMTSQQNEQAEVNRFWRMQLAMLDVSTFSIRECLLDDQPIQGWLADFSTHVVPFVTRHVKSLRGG